MDFCGADVLMTSFIQEMVEAYVGSVDLPWFSSSLPGIW
jgi:hypothetical protein